MLEELEARVLLSTWTLQDGGSGDSGEAIDNGDGTLTYTHDGSETTSDSFVYDIKDLSGKTSNPARVDLNITAQNDAPTLIANTGSTVIAGFENTISSAQMNAADADNVSSDLVFTLVATPAAELFIGTRRLDPGPNPSAEKGARLAEMSPLALENTVFDSLSLADQETSHETDEMKLDVEVWVARTEQVVMAAGLGLVASLLRTGSLLALTATSVPLWKGLDPVAALLICDRRLDQLANEDNLAERIEDDTNDVGRILNDEPSGDRN